MLSEGFTVQTFIMTVAMMSLDLMESRGRTLCDKAADGDPGALRFEVLDARATPLHRKPLVGG
jgi:hypothetical protein